MASISITNGQAAEIPAVGECSPTSLQTHCRTTLRAQLTALSTASASPARALIGRETVGADATNPKTSSWRRSTDSSDRHRPGPSPRRQRLREVVAQARHPDRLGQQPRPDETHRRNVPGPRAHSRVQPGSLHHEGALLLVIHGPRQSALSQEKGAPLLTIQHPNIENSRIVETCPGRTDAS